MIRFTLFLLVLFAAQFLSACASLRPGSPSDGRLPVLATFSVIADLVENVGGEHVAVTTLVGPGTDTHTFNPSPADAAALADARLIFENGAGFETWLDDLYAASGSSAKRIDLSQGVTLRHASDGTEADHGDAHDEAEDEHGHEHDHAGDDPHLWHSVDNVIRMVATIRAALIAADPAHAADYEANAQTYTQSLRALDEWIFTQAQTLPPERRVLVTTHNTFGYYADRYGYTVLGSVLPSSTAGASPSAQELAVLVDAVRSAGVPAVFAENVTANSLLNQVANEAGVQVIGSLYTDALGPPESGADTYVGMLRLNTTTIVTALGS